MALALPVPEDSPLLPAPGAAIVLAGLSSSGLVCYSALSSSLFL